MLGVLSLVPLFALLAALLWYSRRDNEIFQIEIRDGQARVVRGRVPPSFLDDVRRIARGLQSGTVRAVREGGEPRILTSSIDDVRAQRLRNAFSAVGASKL